MEHLRLVVIILFSLILGANAFSYKEAENWGNQYPKCNGKQQSPIIYNPTSISGFSSIDQKLKLTGFDKLPKKLTINNTGHTVEIKADWSGEPPKISGGPLNGTYVLEKTTFLWAQEKWAEEVIPEDNVNDYYMIDMEMHMFFYQADLKSFEKAQKEKGGLAVLKMGLTVLNDNLTNTIDEKFKNLYENLEMNLHKVQSINSTAEIPPFRLASKFENRVPPFLFYEGSLDYPPCWESVTWFISDGDLITKNLLNEFRKIKLAEGDVSNVRPRQELNKRQVKSVYTYKDKE